MFKELLLTTVLIPRAKPGEEGGYLVIIPRVALVYKTILTVLYPVYNEGHSKTQTQDKR